MSVKSCKQDYPHVLFPEANLSQYTVSERSNFNLVTYTQTLFFMIPTPLILKSPGQFGFAFCFLMIWLSLCIFQPNCHNDCVFSSVCCILVCVGGDVDMSHDWQYLPSSPNIMLLRAFNVVQMCCTLQGVSSILLPSRIPQYRSIAICLSNHIWVVSVLGLLCIKLLSTFTYRSQCLQMFSFLLGKCLGVVCKCIFDFITFFQHEYNFLHSRWHCVRVPVAPPCHHHLMLLVFLIPAILNSSHSGVCRGISLCFVLFITQ